MNEDWISKILSYDELCDMGHHQRRDDNNVGLGWIYYGLARIYRPSHIVCVGSWRGFAPMMFARGMADNLEHGLVTFIDPSFVDDFWKDPQKVKGWFNHFGITNISHVCQTTEDFTRSPNFEAMKPIDLLFVDGYHTAECARADHLAFSSKLQRGSLILFHDSISRAEGGMYGLGNEYNYSVCDYMSELRRSGNYELLDIDVCEGLTLARTL